MRGKSIGTTLRGFLRKIEAQYGKADPPVSYLVGTPKGRLGQLEQALVGLPWHRSGTG